MSIEAETKPVSKFDSLLEAIAALTPEETAALRHWFAERDWEAWDRQIEDDCANGRLDHVIAEVEADIAAGRFEKL